MFERISKGYWGVLVFRQWMYPVFLRVPAWGRGSPREFFGSKDLLDQKIAIFLPEIIS
jgi:hypothetical protein